MTGPEIILIAARANNGAIGINGQLPWRLPADLRRFKRITLGSPMIMGRKTFESLPGLLEGRRHIVLTRDTHWSKPGAEIAHSCQAAIDLACVDAGQHISVIGGADIFALFTPYATRFELTEVHCDVNGDTFMPAPDPALWQEIARERHQAQGDYPAYSFVRLVRRTR